MLRKFAGLKKQAGVTAIEYAILAAALAALILAVAGSDSALYQAIDKKFTEIAQQIENSTDGGAGN